MDLRTPSLFKKIIEDSKELLFMRAISIDISQLEIKVEKFLNI